VRALAVQSPTQRERESFEVCLDLSLQWSGVCIDETMVLQRGV